MKVSRVTLVLLFTLFFFSGKAVTLPPELIRVCPTGDSTVDVQWIKPTDVCNSFVEYRIWGRENTSSLFVLLTTENDINTENLSVKLPKAVDITWEFYIEVRFLCDGSTPAFSDTLILDPPPAPLGLDSVSVDFVTQKTIMGWTDSPEDDVQDYIINIGSKVIDSTANTFYSHANSNPTAGATSYRLTVRDLCLQRSPISVPHSTIFLQNDIDSCIETITLKWTRYIGWTSISEYRVFVEVNGGSFTQTASVGGNVTQYTFQYNPGDNYRFYVRAVNGSNNNITSSSNLISQNTRLPIAPSYFYVSQVTVVNNDSISIKWIYDVAGEILEYKVFKSEDGGKQFKLLTTISNDGTGEQLFFDTAVDVNSQSYFYRVAAYDLCGDYIDSTNTSRSIYLRINDLGLLQWNEYTFWDAGVDGYNINRGIDVVPQIFTWNLLDFKTDLPLIYDDSNPPLEIGASGICYYVQSEEMGPNQYGVDETSTSNIVCAIKSPTVFFPNAFKPDGINTHFKPVGAYIDYEKSEMQVYNRWGEMLYDSKEVNVGWNGRDEQGEIYMGGVYIYKAKIYGLDGTFKNFRGTVVLLR